MALDKRAQVNASSNVHVACAQTSLHEPSRKPLRLCRSTWTASQSVFSYGGTALSPTRTVVRPRGSRSRTSCGK